MADYEKALLTAASLARLFASSRPILRTATTLERGRYEGEQAACQFLATLFEQMAEGNRDLVLKMRDMG